MNSKIKAYVTPEGGITVVDPTMNVLPLIRKYDPNFTIESAPPPDTFIPGLQRLRRVYVQDLGQDDLGNTKDSVLWDLHDRIAAGPVTPVFKGEVSLLDLKVELAKREITHCRLCGWECGIDRFQNAGRCGLKSDAYYSDPLVHIQEEAPVTPAATIKLFGCGLSCIYCQAWEHLDVQRGQREGMKLDQDVWDELKKTPAFSTATSLEFVGGNPDENIYPILKTLQSAPLPLRLPVVWNCHLYAAPVTFKLLCGVVDVFLPDFKYGNNECGQKLSGIDDYWDRARAGLDLMVRLPARIIIRLLVMPGHVTCCHLPIIKYLSDYREGLWISLLDQYVPDFKATSTPGMDRHSAKEEIEKVREVIRSYGLREITDHSALFWREKEDGI